MALIKQMIDKTNRTYEYHRIDGIRYGTDKIFVNLTQYKDHAARVAKASPAMMISLSFNKSEINSALPDRPQLYELIKGLPEFSGAQDA